MKSPLITIGITSYNAQATIERAVESALQQTWEQTEIIIVDDCSTDTTAEILKKLEKQHPQIKVFIQTENKGVAATRNEIIKRAKGEFIAFFDDDDVSLPDRVRTQYQRIIAYEEKYANAQPVICYTARQQFYPDATQRYEKTMGTNEGIAPHGEEVALRILTGKPSFNIFGSTATCSQMARRNVYNDLGGFDETFRRSEDTEFNVKAALKGAHFVGIDLPLVQQTMTLSSDKKLEDEKFYMLMLLEKYKNFIAEYSSYPFCHDWLVNKYHYLMGNKVGFMMDMIGLLMSHPVLTLQRIIWALPNMGFNKGFKKFYETS